MSLLLIIELSSWLSASPFFWVIVDKRGTSVYRSSRGFRTPLIAWDAGVAELDALIEPQDGCGHREQNSRTRSAISATGRQASG